MHLDRVLDKKDYILFLSIFTFGILCGMYINTFMNPKPEPQVIILNKEQLQKDLQKLFQPQISQAERQKIEKQNAIERMTRN